MSNKKQTAIEWYTQQRNLLQFTYDTTEMSVADFFEREEELKLKANKMFKEQIIEAYGEPHYAEQYFKDTYAGDNE
jgi:predicted GIY-YIG superfamily endonuclease